MISARKILQIHRCIVRSLEQDPPARFRIRRILQILDWITLLVTQDQTREGYEPCIFSRAAELFYLITSERPFQHYNLLTALCAVEWWLRNQGVSLQNISLDDLQALLDKVNCNYQNSLLSACNDFAEDYRFWFFMHSKPTCEHNIGVGEVITSISRTFATLHW
ncbi:hypothetical protein D3C80_740320 [compost metagenome]